MGAWTLEMRARVVAALVEGNSIRGTGRMLRVDKNAVLELAMRVGDGCGYLHDRLVRNLSSLIIEGDETWSFIQKKEARVAKGNPTEHGDAYTFVALDAVSRLVIAYRVGKRDEENTDAFAADLRARLTMVPHLTTDGFLLYRDVIEKHFGGSVDYGQAIKNYASAASLGPDHHYEPSRDPFVTRAAVFGAPSPSLITTAHVERYNLTQRHIVGRTRRLCLAFSKTKRGHVAGIALGVMAYNFVRVNAALGTTPAVAAGIASRPWTVAELTAAAMAERQGEKPVAVPLKMPAERDGVEVGAARELPGGKGWLRAVPGGEDEEPPSDRQLKLF